MLGIYVVGFISIIETAFPTYDHTKGYKVEDHQEIGNKYIVPDTVIYTDNYNKSNSFYETESGTTRHFDTVLVNDFNGTYFKKYNFNDSEPNISYSIAGTEYEILEVYNCSGPVHNPSRCVYILKDDKGVTSHTSSSNFEQTLRSKDNYHSDVLEIEYNIKEILSSNSNRYILTFYKKREPSEVDLSMEEFIRVNNPEIYEERKKEKYLELVDEVIKKDGDEIVTVKIDKKEDVIELLIFRHLYRIKNIHLDTEENQ